MLLPDDERYLTEKGYTHEVLPNGESQQLIIKQYPLPAGFSATVIDLLIEIPAGYPDSGLDMFWVYPEITLITTNARPAASDTFEVKADQRNWQRFSRHGYPWRNGDSISSYLTWIRRELERNGSAS